MKKILYTLTMTLLFFCLIQNNLPKADAAVCEKTLFDNTVCKPGDYYILNKGYYIFVGESQVLESNFKGDFAYFLVEGDTGIDTAVFGEEIPFDFQYHAQIQDIAQRMGDLVSENTLKRGIAFLTVNSAAILNINHELEHMFCNYLEVEETKQDLQISGGMTHFVNVDKRTPLLEIQNRYSARDNVDGDITNAIQFETNYVDTSSPIGTYYIMATVCDQAGNKISSVDYIIVRDFTPPFIHLIKNEIEQEVNQEFLSEEAKAYFSFEDNYTASEELKIYFVDTYQDNYNTVGTYTISAYAKDKQGNISETKTLTIHIKDKTPPTILLAAGGNEITANHILTDEEIKALLLVEDNYDAISEENIRIIENTCNGEQGKRYQITIEAEDEAGNIGTNTFSYYLLDTTSPIIMVNQTLYIELGISYTSEQIIAMLKEAGILSPDATTVELSSSLIEEKSEEGIYTLYFTETMENGEIKNGSVKLHLFTPIKEAKEPQSPSFLWLWSFALLPILFGVIFFFRHKHYEKA